MNVVTLDARHWKEPDDFYKSLLRKLGAPEWHGHSIPSLIDSMTVGDINQVGLPTRVVVTGIREADLSAFDEMIAAFAALARYGGTAQITADRATLEIVGS